MVNPVQTQLDDETIFPTKLGVGFAKNFHSTVKCIFKRLFRVYAHMYLVHYDQFVILGIEKHLGTSFRHFILFVLHFKLVPSKELAPMDPLIKQITARNDQDEL